MKQEVLFKGDTVHSWAYSTVFIRLNRGSLDFGHLMESCRNKKEIVWEFMGIHRSACKFMIIIWGNLWETQDCVLP